MRTFIAIDIPSEIRLKIAELVMALEPKAPNIRWTKPSAMHITLKFLGEVPEAKLESIKTSLAAVRLPAPFTLKIEGAGYFPNGRSPRVIWLGVATGRELPELATLIEERIQPLGFPKENRAYAAHVTLGRVRESGKIALVQELLRQREPLRFGSFTADRFFLYESKPSPGGSLYLKMAGFEFAPGGESQERAV